MNHPIKYRLSALAKNDLNAIFKYTIQSWGENQAQKYAKNYQMVSIYCLKNQKLVNQEKNSSPMPYVSQSVVI